MNDEAIKTNKNYFILNRRLFDNEIWYLEPFTKAQAWVDLIGNANYKDVEISIRGNIIKIQRGQLGWSELTMASRWHWSRNKVRRFLNWLETKQQIKQQKTAQTSITTIVNYEEYQFPIQQTEQQTIQQKDSRKTADDTQLIKEEKKKEEIILREDTPAQLAKKFFENQEETIQFLIGKGLDSGMVRAEIQKFVLYWTEPNGSGTKQRWQMQPTFDVKRRLTTWFSNKHNNKLGGSNVIRIS